MKPHKSEDLHVRDNELKYRLEMAAERQRVTSDAERHRLKEAHWMHCPKCGQKLATERFGSVDIDVCPSCKGLWLDSNELETIMADAGKTSFFQSCLKILRG